MSKAEHEIIQNILDGSATEIEFHGFQQRMRDNAGLRRLYREYATLYHCLSEEFETARLRVLPAPANPRGIWLTTLLATAAAVAVAAGLVWLQRGKSAGDVIVEAAPIPAAHITFSAEAAWKFSTGAQALDNTASLAAGTTVQLERGVANITLEPGVSGLIEAPAELIYENPKLVRLVDGRARFRVAPEGHGFTVRTRSIEAKDLGTEFAVSSRRGAADELHVFDGRVELRTPSLAGTGEVPVIAAGHAARVSPTGAITPMAAEPSAFRRTMPVEQMVLHDNFKDSYGSMHGRVPTQGGGSWQVRHGQAILQGEGVNGRGFEAFCRLQGPPVGASQPILLAKLELGESADGPIHGPGWAGLSLFAGGREIVFFGDSYGEEKSWSLDIKQGQQPLLPKTPIAGARTMTLRYDWRTGVTTLFDGPHPTGMPVVRGQLPAGIVFDEVRVGSSSEAAIMARLVSVELLDAP